MQEQREEALCPLGISNMKLSNGGSYQRVTRLEMNQKFIIYIPRTEETQTQF